MEKEPGRVIVMGRGQEKDRDQEMVRERVTVREQATDKAQPIPEIPGTLLKVERIITNSSSCLKGKNGKASWRRRWKEMRILKRRRIRNMASGC
jgi:hypothetical protein